jgi:hypothetical protein
MRPVRLFIPTELRGIPIKENEIVREAETGRIKIGEGDVLPVQSYIEYSSTTEDVFSVITVPIEEYSTGLIQVKAIAAIDDCSAVCSIIKNYSFRKTTTLNINSPVVVMSDVDAPLAAADIDATVVDENISIDITTLALNIEWKVFYTLDFITLTAPSP